MRVEFTVPDHAALIERVLEGFIQASELLIRAGAVGKPTLDVQLGDDDVVSWQFPTQVAESKYCDCEDLVIWWAAYLRATGRDPGAGARIQATGPLTTHCLLKLSSGKLVDVYQEHLAAQQAAGYQMSGIFSSIGNAVKSAVKGVGKAASAGASAVKQGVKAAGRGIEKAAGATYHGIGDAASAVGRGVETAAGATYHGIGDAARAVGRGTEAVGSGLFDATKAVGRGIGDAAGAVGRLPGDIVRGAGGVLSDVGHGVSDFASAAGGAIGDVVSGGAGLAADIIEAPTKLALGIGERILGDVTTALTPQQQPGEDNLPDYQGGGGGYYPPDDGGNMLPGYPEDFDAFAGSGVDPSAVGGDGFDEMMADYAEDDMLGDDAFGDADFDQSDDDGFDAFAEVA